MKLGVAIVALAMTALAGCGDDAEDKLASATATPAPRIAPELIGTWKARIPRSEIPGLQAPPNGPRPGRNWEIELLADGGIGNAPALVYANKAGMEGTLTYEVSGDRIAITDDNCSSGPSENVYAFAVDGEELTFETVESNCPEQVLEDLLTARPWRRG